jgi:hypothetical protein
MSASSRRDLNASGLVLSAESTSAPTLDLVHLLNTNPKKLIRLIVKFVELNISKHNRMARMATDDTLNDILSDCSDEPKEKPDLAYRVLWRLVYPKKFDDDDNEIEAVNLNITYHEEEECDLPVRRDQLDQPIKWNQPCESPRIDEPDHPYLSLAECFPKTAASSDVTESELNEEQESESAGILAEAPHDSLEYTFQKKVSYDLYSNDEIVGDEYIYSHGNDSTGETFFNSKFSHFLIRDKSSAERDKILNKGRFDYTLSSYAFVDVDALFKKNLTEKGVKHDCDRHYLLVNEHWDRTEPARPIRRLLADAHMNPNLKLYTICNVKCIHRKEVNILTWFFGHIYYQN